MTDEERDALQAGGWVFGNAEDFLELTPGEILAVEDLANKIKGDAAMEPNAESLEALKDIEEGHLTRWSSVDEMFENLGIKVKKGKK
jgi:hypothetical protein